LAADVLDVGGGRIVTLVPLELFDEIGDGRHASCRQRDGVARRRPVGLSRAIPHFQFEIRQRHVDETCIRSCEVLIENGGAGNAGVTGGARVDSRRQIEGIDLRAARVVDRGSLGEIQIFDRQGSEGDLDVVGGGNSHLHVHGLGVFADQLQIAVPGCLVRDATNFLDELVELDAEEAAIFGGVGAVGRLHRKFAHAMQHVLNFVDRAFGGLRHRDSVTRVADGHVETLDLVTHALRDRDSGGIIDGAIDALARGEALHRLFHVAAVERQRALGLN